MAEFFKKPSTGSVCGRFMTDQLDRNIEIPRKRIPWVKYFFQFALPAFLLSLKSSSVKAQGTVSVKKINKSEKCRKPLIGDTTILKEIVIVAKPSQVHTKSPYNSGLDPVNGQFVNKLEGKVAGPVVTVMNKIPDITANRDLSNPSVMATPLFEGSLGGVVVVAGGVSVKRTRNKEKKSIPLVTQLFKDTALKFFKVFPNPVPSGSNLTIEWGQREEGYYSLQLLNQSGQPVHQQEIWIDAAARLLNVDIPSVATGNYFLVLANKKTGKKFTEKIVIQ